MVTRNTHALIVRLYEYATLCGKRNLADVIYGKDIEVGRLSWIIQMDPI